MMDPLHNSGERRQELEIARKCRAQAMRLMREGKSALRLLLQLQAARQKVEADEVAANRAAWAEHALAGLMEEALGPVPATPKRSAALTPAPMVGRDGVEACAAERNRKVA